MNLLIDEVPKSVEIKGIEYDLFSDFRTSILFELLMYSDGLSDSEKLTQALALYFPEIPLDFDLALQAIYWFYRGGKDEIVEQQGSDEHCPLIYSYDFDDDYIYAAFLDQYNINLQTVPYLHWWEFKALFRALKEDNEIVKIMGYRGIKIDNKMTREQKSFYREMKMRYALPDQISSSELEKNRAIEDALSNGGDLEGVL